MNKHSPTQQLVFFKWINNLIDNDFLALEIRSRLKGENLAVKKYIQELPTPTMLQQDAYEALWTYIRLQDIKSENLYNATKDVQILVECYADIEYLKEELNKKLEVLGLPEL